MRDITIPRLRGTVGGLFGVFLVMGIIFGNTIGLKEVKYVLSFVAVRKITLLKKSWSAYV